MKGPSTLLWTRCFLNWDSLVLDRDSCFPGISIIISNKITNLVTHSLYPLITTIFLFILSTFLRRFSCLWFLFPSTSNRGRDLLFVLFFLLSGKICCWSRVSSQMTFSWRLVQCSIRTILKPIKDKNSICNQLVTSAILEIIERFKITFTANVKLYHVTNFSFWFILCVCYLLFLHGNKLFLVMLIDQMYFVQFLMDLFTNSAAILN